MLNKEEFIKFILADPKGRSAPSTKVAGGKAKSGADALGGYGFDNETSKPEPTASNETTFARQLLEASGFGAAQYLATGEVILGGDPAAQHLPQRVYYWPKTAGRPYQTILFELTQTSGALLNAPLFKPLKGVLEDALTRLVQDTLKGFEIGGERRKADVKQGKQDETLCVVSIRDERNKESGASHLICFGTVARGEGSLETFHIREEARFWEPQLAKDHLERLYDRHFKKLATDKWQDAFISGEERKLARKLMDVSHGKRVDESKIQEAVVDLLEEIALSYGLRKKPGGRRLEATDLPQDHDIGIKDGALSSGAKNPFRGMTLRDEKNRLLGYIIYCLDQKEDAEVLRAHLEKNNRFHNVLVVYPNGESTGLELWQGNKPLLGKLTKRGANFEGEGQVVNLLSRFFVVSKALVTNPAELAAELAYRARYLRGFALRELEKPELLRDKDLSKLYNSFHDIFLKGEEKGKDEKEVEAKKHDEFADSYAQTLTYGLLSARWISKDELAAKGDRFTLDNATGLLERTSPFFKELFTQVINRSHDASRDWLLQDITDLLDRIDIDAVFTGVQDDVLLGHDPVMHFYEPFLEAYDAAIKRQRGVFYTPHPAVSYIVRSVHELLQTEFGLEDGLADITTWGEMIKKHPSMKLPPLTDEPGNKQTISPTEPFVLILDPATGTATFLVEVIDVIFRTLVVKWKKLGLTETKINAAWNEYVPKHLLPRLYGYELMMAPYAIAHLKIGLKLAETGYRFATKQRANVYLTNSLEPAQDFSGRLAFDAPALAHEAAAVNEIKRHKRFTVVIGNPPYSHMTANPSKALRGIVDIYRDLDGEPIREKGAIMFERTIQDDYVKFHALGDRLTAGHPAVRAYITNSAYLDNPTLRGMRCYLTHAWEATWLLDLHGDVKRAGDGDENVFDIRTGVAIAVFSRAPRAVSGAQVFFGESAGPRTEKYSFLSSGSIHTTHWSSLTPQTPYYRFRLQSGEDVPELEESPLIHDVFVLKSEAIKTNRDHFVIGDSDGEILCRIRAFIDPSKTTAEVKQELHLNDNAQWTVDAGRKDCRGTFSASHLASIAYRPFDDKRIYYHPSVVFNPRPVLAENVLGRKNLVFLTSRRIRTDVHAHYFVSDKIAVKEMLSSADNCNGYPLYRYEKHLSKELRLTNFTPDFLKTLATRLGLRQSGEHGLPDGLTPEDIFYYAYAVFHSPGYRNRYAEFLKIDFPRLPLTGNLELFQDLSKRGNEIVSLHLMEAPKTDIPRSKFVGSPNPTIGRIAWVKDTVWIDAPVYKKGDSQAPGKHGFEGVSEELWNFHIGSYQICDKWLKDRKGRTLTDDDIAHYHKIVIAIAETIRLMKEIDDVIDKHGGWPGAFQIASKATKSETSAKL